MRALLSTTCKGSALVWVLVCMSLVGGLLTATLSTLLYDRKLILHERELLRAEAAVQAALAHAQSMLCKAITRYPDSATVWEEHLPGLKTPGTALHIFERGPSHQPARILVLPLISGVQQPLPIGQNPFDPLPELCNFNQMDQWICEVDREGKTAPISAPWILLIPEKEAPVLARYAFVLEDESFKLNIQTASPQQPSTVLRNPRDLSLQAIFAQLPNISEEIQGKWAQELFALREKLGGFKDLGQSNLVMHLDAFEWNRWKSLCTIFSEALNYTRHGLPRTNINNLFFPTTSLGEIRQQLDHFISTLRRESPHFGQRFYRPQAASFNQIGTAPKEREEIYLNKLAANIRDILLPGPNPTRVLNQKDYPILAPGDLSPVLSPNGLGPNPLVAVGKKRIPYLQEYALAARLIKIEPPTKTPTDPLSGANFEITIDHFLEFWNLSDKPIRVEDLGPNARLILRNQPPWDLDGGGKKGFGIPPPSQRNLEIPLAHFKSIQNKQPLVFRPGEATVLTTFPGLPPLNLFSLGTQFFTASDLDPKKRTFSGTTYRTYREKDKQTGLLMGPLYYAVRGKLRSQGNADYETEYLLLNDNGWIDGFSHVPIITNIVMRSKSGQHEGGAGWHLRSSGLQGDERGSDQIGDPRTLNEQLLLGEKNMTPGKNAAMDNARSLLDDALPHTRFLENARPGKFPSKSSLLGTIRSSYIDFRKWGDPVYSEDGSLTPAIFPEVPLKTIAELGHVFDPARGAILNVDRDRGGGRSLRIGQPEFYSKTAQQPGIWDRDPLSPNREWTAWRLCDIFSVSNRLVLPGAVNINGVLRQEGVLLKALLHDFQWSRAGAGELGGSPLEDEDIQLMVDHFQRRLRRKPPYENRGCAFFERGEISEIDLFQSEEAFPVTLANRTRFGLKNRNDSVREEIVRYLLEAITTRGRVFSVYCVGQAVRLRGKLQTLATRRAKFTFRLVPLDANGKRLDHMPDSLVIYNKELNPPAQYGVELLARED